MPLCSLAWMPWRLLRWRRISSRRRNNGTSLGQVFSGRESRGRDRRRKRSSTMSRRRKYKEKEEMGYQEEKGN